MRDRRENVTEFSGPARLSVADAYACMTAQVFSNSSVDFSSSLVSFNSILSGHAISHLMFAAIEKLSSGARWLSVGGLGVGTNERETYMGGPCRIQGPQEGLEITKVLLEKNRKQKHRWRID